jgi:WD40 repeat protein
VSIDTVIFFYRLLIVEFPSSDSRVMLHNAASVSSEPAGQADESEEADDDVDLDDSFDISHKSSDPLEDGVLATYEEHEDSVYSVEWSAADPWVFASLSYDGRLVINRVPRTYKYRILL